MSLHSSLALIRAFCLIPPTQQQRLADVIKCLCDNNFYLDDCAMYELSSEQCHELGETIPRLTECAESSGSLPSGPCTSLLISGTNAINRLKQLCSGIFPHLLMNHKCLN